MRVSVNGRQALEQALRDGELRRTFDGKPGQPAWPAPAATLAALVRNGLMTCSERRNRKAQLMVIWELSDQGREALETPARVVRDTVNSMRANGAARSRLMVGGVWKDVTAPEPEKIDVKRLSPEWARQARQRHEHDRPTGRRAA